jgi:hypothetical protein
VLHDDGVEEDDVLVAEGGEEGVFGEGGGTLHELGEGTFALLVERVDLVAVEMIEGENTKGRGRGKGKRTGGVRTNRKCHALRE